MNVSAITTTIGVLLTLGALVFYGGQLVVNTNNNTQGIQKIEAAIIKLQDRVGSLENKVSNLEVNLGYIQGVLSKTHMPPNAPNAPNVRLDSVPKTPAVRGF